MTEQTDLVERLAREAGVQPMWCGVLLRPDGTTTEPFDPALKRFATLIAEYCADLSEHTAEIDVRDELIVGKGIARAIRAAFKP